MPFLMALVVPFVSSALTGLLASPRNSGMPRHPGEGSGPRARETQFKAGR